MNSTFQRRESQSHPAKMIKMTFGKDILQSGLPKWLQAKVNSPPKAGLGVHQYLYLTARHLHAHMDAAAIEKLLAERVTGCGRPVREREIKSAVENAARVAWRPKRP